MPFDDHEQKPSAQSQKIGLKKKVSSQKSVFEELPKKPTQEVFDRQVKAAQEHISTYKTRAADLTVQFNRAMADKTLPINRNPFQKEVENELLRGMVRLAQEVNADGQETEGEGNLSWIIVLLKTCFAQRDRLNNLEYAVSKLEKKTDPTAISKEVAAALDKLKTSE